MKKLILIRHGLTKANEEHRYCGSSDVPLSPKGIQSLTKPDFMLENPRFFTSGMRRTEATLEVLFGPVPHDALPAFREVDFGAFELQTYEKLKERADYRAWLSGDNMKNVPPGGESGQAFTARVLAALPELLKYDGETVLVTHGGVIAAIMAELFPYEEKSRYEWQSPHGHGYIIEIDTHEYTQF